MKPPRAGLSRSAFFASRWFANAAMPKTAAAAAATAYEAPADEGFPPPGARFAPRAECVRAREIFEIIVMSSAGMHDNSKFIRTMLQRNTNRREAPRFLWVWLN